MEALSVALYNRPTWSGRGVQALRADNAPAMRVVLTFTVSVGSAPQRWTVTRIHRTGTSPALHKLECAQTGEKVDNCEAINARIETLIGLTHDQFTKAMAVPQGQFARLLEATEGERTKILKGIFRLDPWGPITRRRV
jgi:exonuclease SbcC